MIDSYKFGRMVIDGEVHTKDVIVRPGKIEGNWWRKQGHRLEVGDIRHVIEEDKPEVLVMGTGKYGIVQIAPETKAFLKEHGVELFAARTDDAVARFNQFSKTKRVVGAFHLTC